MLGQVASRCGSFFTAPYVAGDAWTFEIVAGRPEAGPAPPAPRILESHGEAPPQFGEGWNE
jgi:hypothetical protein